MCAQARARPTAVHCPTAAAVALFAHFALYFIGKMHFGPRDGRPHARIFRKCMRVCVCVEGQRASAAMEAFLFMCGARTRQYTHARPMRPPSFNFVYTHMRVRAKTSHLPTPPQDCWHRRMCAGPLYASLSLVICGAASGRAALQSTPCAPENGV